MSVICSLEKFISELDASASEDFPTILNKLQLDKTQFKKYELWKNEGYSRSCIKRTNTYELILLCWNAGDKTPIHNHDGQKCWVYQVSGTISEHRFEEKNNSLVNVESMILHPGTLTYMDDYKGFHSLENSSNTRALTLHVYMKPIENCEYFCNTDHVFKSKKLQYDTEPKNISEEITPL